MQVYVVMFLLVLCNAYPTVYNRMIEEMREYHFMYDNFNSSKLEQ